jgi:hypothetical protein
MFGPARTVERVHIWEAGNLLVRGSDRHLWVDYKAPPAPESIPPLLWGYAATHMRRHGIFLAPASPRREDIPF